MKQWEIEAALTWEEAQKMAAEGWELTNVAVYTRDTGEGLTAEREYWFKREVPVNIDPKEVFT